MLQEKHNKYQEWTKIILAEKEKYIDLIKSACFLNVKIFERERKKLFNGEDVEIITYIRKFRKEVKKSNFLKLGNMQNHKLSEFGRELAINLAKEELDSKKQAQS